MGSILGADEDPIMVIWGLELLDPVLGIRWLFWGSKLCEKMFQPLDIFQHIERFSMTKISPQLEFSC